MQTSITSGHFLSYLTNISTQLNMTNLINFNVVGSTFTSPNITYFLNYSQSLNPTNSPTTIHDYQSFDESLNLLWMIPLFIGIIIMTHIVVEYIKCKNKIYNLDSNANINTNYNNLSENTIESNSLSSIVPLELAENNK